MTEHKKDNDAALVLFVLGIFLALAIIILPFVWSQARAELNKPKVSVLVTEDCKEGKACQICNEEGNKKVCVDGICDAKGNCLTTSVPANKNTTPKMVYPGLRGSVL